MTVGIAAICDSGKRIVVADRMFTNSASRVEFETLERKIEPLAPTCSFLQSSNDVSIVSEIVDSVRLQMKEPHDFSVSRLADLIQSSYIKARLRLLDERLVVPALGSDYVRHREHGDSLPDYLKNQPILFQSLTQRMEQHDLSVYLLVAGVDHSGSHLFQVVNPGVCQNMDKLGYAAIGSGQHHALVCLQLAKQTRQTDLLTTMLDVYNAKRVSEVAPGVGK
jgi:Proteasome subunit